jgi:outer membrane protein TolC
VRALLAALLLLPAAAARTLTLPEAYALALARSEEIARTGAAYEETVARAEEVFSNVLPRVGLRATEQLQHVPKGMSGLFLQPNREQAQFTLRQPIFAGFREFLAWRAAKDQGEAARLRLERAKQLLYQDAARAYLDLLDAQDEIAVRQALVDNTADRVKELQQRLAVGRSRRSELLAAEASESSARAQVEQARAAERSAQLRLRFLTGLDEELAAAPLPDAGPAPRLEAALIGAAARPDAAAARSELDAASRNARVAARERWPTIALDANYYLKRPPSFTDRVKWDATIAADLPLYAGGETGARRRQREARLRAAQATLDEALRRAALEARVAHEDWRAAEAVVAARGAALKAAEANAKAQADDYRVGMVTNLDVLGALNALQEARLAHAQARLDAHWARVRLETAAGAVPGAKLP